MPKRSSNKKPQKDAQELARHVLDSVVGKDDASDNSQGEVETPQKNPAAVALGRLGGLKGGKARAEKLTAKQRSEIAKKAAAKRWGHDETGEPDPSSSSSGGESG